MSPSELSRFMLKVQPEPNTGCWLWDAAVGSSGYGQMGVTRQGRKRMAYAHRLAFEHWNGPIPDDGPGHHGWCVCHRCDVRLCVNPEHLFLGSQAENVSDMVDKGRLPKSRDLARGVQHAHAKLDPEKVRAIRRRVASGESISSIARTFEVSRRCVRSVVARETWAHVDDVPGSRQRFWRRASRGGAS